MAGGRATLRPREQRLAQPAPTNGLAHHRQDLVEHALAALPPLMRDHRDDLVSDAGDEHVLVHVEPRRVIPPMPELGRLQHLLGTVTQVGLGPHRGDRLVVQLAIEVADPEARDRRRIGQRLGSICRSDWGHRPIMTDRASDDSPRGTPPEPALPIHSRACPTRP